MSRRALRSGPTNLPLPKHIYPGKVFCLTIFSKLSDMKKILPLVLLALIPFAVFSQQGYQQDLNHVASLTFPTKPTATVQDVKTIYVLSDSGIVYLAAVAPYKKGVKDLFTKNINDSLFHGAMQGSLQSAKGKLIYQKPVDMNGLKGLEFAYQADLDSVKSYRYHQVFYLNNTLIFYGYWSKESLQTDDKGMRSFFNSFTLKVKPTEANQQDASNLAYNVGKGIGYVLIAGAIVLLGLGVVFLIRKFS